MPSDPSTHNTIDLSQSEIVWDALTGILDAYSDAWESAPPEPILERFIPAADQPYRLLTLVELIKVDLEQRARRGLSLASLETYTERWPDLFNSLDQIPADLIYEDYLVRRRHQQHIDLHDYTNRFPAAATALKRMVGGRDSGASTSIGSVRRVPKFEPGEKVDDFDLLVQLGKGAFAIVFLARQNSMQRLVALKVSADQGFEPQTLAQLDHPNIVRVFDQRKLPDQNVRLMYMQYLAGGTLQDVIESMRPIPRDQWNGDRFVAAIDTHVSNRGEEPAHLSVYRNELRSLTWPHIVSKIGEQLASALDYAHQRDVLHRDVKPANVLLSADGSAKLVDFNVSFSGEVEGASPAAFFGGSLIYMSPEQLEACDPHHERAPDQLDGRSDLYSLGVLLFELLSGERPFGDEFVDVNWKSTLGEMIARRRQGIPTHRWEMLFESHHGVTELLTDAIVGCLRPEPIDRCQSAAALTRQLHWATQPDAEQLLCAPELMTQPIIGQLAALVTVVLLILPNALAAVFVYSYNSIESVPEALRSTFFKTQSIINGITFPLATGLILYAIVPVALAVHQINRRSVAADSVNIKRRRAGNLHASDPTSPVRFDHARIRAGRSNNMLLGHWGACICFPFWALAGAIYPTVLGRQTVPLPQSAWFDFVGSHLLAGFISAAYIFFGITYFCLRAWQPQFMRATIETPLDDTERGNLRRLTILVPFYHAVSAVIPFVAISLLVIWGEASNRMALSVLSVASLIGTMLLLWVSKRLQGMVASLQKMA